MFLVLRNSAINFSMLLLVLTAAVLSVALSATQNSEQIYCIGSQIVSQKYDEKHSHHPRNCADLQDAGDQGKGLRVIYPFCGCEAPLVVFCDQDTDGGGWTVFQRRDDLIKREDFSRTWTEYTLGFGNKTGEFWLGLNSLYALTSQSLQELRVDLENFKNEYRWAKYGVFSIDAPETGFVLSTGRYIGTAGDGLAGGRHTGSKFSTNDRDNDVYDGNCAELYKGGWWYDKCHVSNLNGFPYEGEHESYADGIEWQPWTGYHYSLKKTVMMIRPAFRETVKT